MGRRSYIPQDGSELTPAWFSEVLGGSVTAVDRQLIGDGIGFMGELHRCRLTWSDGSDAGPEAVVVKMPSQVVKNRSLGEALQVYEREIVVYRELADRLGVSVPTHHHSDLDPNPAPWLERVLVVLFERLPVGGVSWVLNRLLGLGARSKRRYLLVMEDVADARPPTQAQGGSLDDALEGLRVLARFHAANWMAEEVVAHHPIVWGVDRTPKVVQASYRRNREPFMARFASALGPAMVAHMDRIQAELCDLAPRLTEPPWTLLHGDYRLDNLLFRPDGEVVVLDWQGMGYGRAGWDVAYFITTALAPEHRTEEAVMLETYHQALLEAGVTGYDRADLDADVRLTKEILVHRMVAGDDLLDTAKDGDEALVDVLVTRVAGWLET